MVFLEFFEALLECALVYVTEDMILKQEAEDNQKTGSSEINLPEETSAVSVTEPSALQVKMMQTFPMLLCVHLESKVRL